MKFNYKQPWKTIPLIIVPVVLLSGCDMSANKFLSTVFPDKTSAEQPAVAATILPASTMPESAQLMDRIAMLETELDSIRDSNISINELQTENRELREQLSTTIKDNQQLAMELENLSTAVPDKNMSQDITLGKRNSVLQNEVSRIRNSMKQMKLLGNQTSQQREDKISQLQQSLEDTELKLAIATQDLKQAHQQIEMLMDEVNTTALSSNESELSIN